MTCKNGDGTGGKGADGAGVKSAADARVKGAGGTGVRLRVNAIGCEGRGLCAELLPELIRLDDWGYPIISAEPVPGHLLADARETVRACPLLALRLETRR